MTQQEKERLLYGEWKEHDMAACNALAEYDAWCDAGQRGPNGVLRAQQIADKHGTTIEEMKRHYGCLKDKK